jgi:hypothetical protein
MTAEDDRTPVTLPAETVRGLAALLTELDEFLCSGPIVSDDLALFLASRGHAHPRFVASNMIDEVSFTATGLRQLTGGTGSEYPQDN